LCKGKNGRNIPKEGKKKEQRKKEGKKERHDVYVCLPRFVRVLIGFMAGFLHALRLFGSHKEQRLTAH
jgi:hypothetical protein